MAFGAALAGCASPSIAPAPAPAPVTLAEAAAPESVDPFRGAGLVVGEGSIPFVGMVRFGATEYLDSTTVLVALSIPPRALSFVRAGDRYAAFYSMRIDVMRGDAIVRTERSSGEVRVANFSETTRGDEGVIFQRSFQMSPGIYSLRLTAQDSLSPGSGVATTALTVPALAEGTTAPMIPVFSVEGRRARGTALTVVANARAAVRYGRDSLLQLYLESYGTGTPDTILLVARRENSRGATLLVDTIVAPPRGAVRAMQSSLAVARLGIGSVHLAAVSTAGAALDSLTAVVTLGVDLPVGTVAELSDVLRYFVSEAELSRFRSASEVGRPAQWAALVRRTDPNPATPDNEALLEFARRIRVADRLFRSGPRRGWQSDRGAVLAALGEPDSMSEPTTPDPRGSPRFITWEYRRHRLFLVFSDGPDPGAWRLTPISDGDFRALVSILGPCAGCR